MQVLCVPLVCPHDCHRADGHSLSEGQQNCFSRTISNQPVASLAPLGRCGFSSVAAFRIPSAGRDTSVQMMMMYFWMGDFAALRTPTIGLTTCWISEFRISECRILMV